MNRIKSTICHTAELGNRTSDRAPQLWITNKHPSDSQLQFHPAQEPTAPGTTGLDGGPVTPGGFQGQSQRVTAPPLPSSQAAQPHIPNLLVVVVKSH